MDRREQYALQLEIGWTVKHGKDRDYKRLQNRLTSWMFEDEDE